MKDAMNTNGGLFDLGNSFLNDSLPVVWTWPPIGGLLNPCPFDNSKPRNEWTPDEWRMWAEYLEEQGKNYATEIVRLTDERRRLYLATALRAYKRKRGRPPTIFRPAMGLLSIAEEKKKRGRPPRSHEDIEFYELCEAEFQKRRAQGAVSKRLTFIRQILDPDGTKSKAKVEKAARAIAKRMPDFSPKYVIK